MFERIAPRFFEVAFLVQQPKIFPIIRPAARKWNVMIDMKLSANERLEAKDAAAILFIPKPLNVFAAMLLRSAFEFCATIAVMDIVRFTITGI